MSIRQRLGAALLGDEMRRLRESTELFLDAYQRGPALLSPLMLERGLREIDSQLLDLIMRQRGYTLLTPGGKMMFSEQDRLRVVDESRYYNHYDAQTWRATSAWTDFGFGESVQIEPRDEAGAAVWQEFRDAKRNAPIFKQRRFHKLSDDLLTDGEIFFIIYTSRLDGRSTLRRLHTEDIASIQHFTGTDQIAPDEDVPVFYVQSGIDGAIWWPDWMATNAQLEATAATMPQGARRADEHEMTDVKVVHLTVNSLDGRGWPQFSRGFEWSKAYKDFLGDRATVARAVATYVDTLTVKGGSRAVDSVVARLESSLTSASANYETNPAPASGSTWVQNEAITRTRNSLATGAGDAQLDGMTLLGQMSASDGVPLNWRGRPDAMQNRATARENLRPWIESMERYQQLWADGLGDIVEVVLTQYEKYATDGARFSTYEADVSLESPVDLDITEVNEAIGVVSNAISQGSIAPDLGARVMDELLTRLLAIIGTADAADVVNPEPDEVRAEAMMPRPSALSESHVAETVYRVCPLCGNTEAFNYAGHKGLLVCSACLRTYDPEVE